MSSAFDSDSDADRWHVKKPFPVLSSPKKNDVKKSGVNKPSVQTSITRTRDVPASAAVGAAEKAYVNLPTLSMWVREQDCGRVSSESMSESTLSRRSSKSSSSTPSLPLISPPSTPSDGRPSRASRFQHARASVTTSGSSRHSSLLSESESEMSGTETSDDESENERDILLAASVANMAMKKPAERKSPPKKPLAQSLPEPEKRIVPEAKDLWRSEPLKVLARLRPLLVNEVLGHKGLAINEIRALEKVDESRLRLKRGRQNLVYSLDGVYGVNNTQQDVFSAVEDVVDSVIAGFNGSVFSYGQANSGKTYTMHGANAEGQKTKFAEEIHADAEAQKGILQRAVKRLFGILNGVSGSRTYEVYCSYMEVYKESVHDLIRSKPLNQRGGGLEVCAGKGLPEVKGLSHVAVETADDVLELFEKSTALRMKGQKQMKSHTIFQVVVEQEGSSVGRDSSVKVISKLTLVDLAGPEKHKPGDGQWVTEVTKINQGLTALSRCIYALAEGAPHVPYRESKLTRVLQDCLGGSCRTVFMVGLSPAVSATDDSHSSLRLATKARKVTQKPAVNIVDSSSFIVPEKLAPAAEIARLTRLLRGNGQVKQETSQVGRTAIRKPAFSRVSQAPVRQRVGKAVVAEEPRLAAAKKLPSRDMSPYESDGYESDHDRTLSQEPTARYSYSSRQSDIYSPRRRGHPLDRAVASAAMTASVTTSRSISNGRSSGLMSHGGESTDQLHHEISTLRESQQEFRAEMVRLRYALQAQQEDPKLNALKGQIEKLERENLNLRRSKQQADARAMKSRQERDIMRYSIRGGDAAPVNARIATPQRLSTSESRESVLKKHLADLSKENSSLKQAMQDAEATIQKERAARGKMRNAIQNALAKQSSYSSHRSSLGSIGPIQEGVIGGESSSESVVRSMDSLRGGLGNDSTFVREQKSEATTKRESSGSSMSRMQPRPPAHAKPVQAAAAPPVQYRSKRTTRPPAATSIGQRSGASSRASGGSSNAPRAPSKPKEKTFQRSTVTRRSVGPNQGHLPRYSGLSSIERAAAAAKAKGLSHGEDEELFEAMRAGRNRYGRMESHMPKHYKAAQAMADTEFQDELHDISSEVTYQSSAMNDPPLNADEKLVSPHLTLRDSRHSSVRTPQANALLTSVRRNAGVGASVSKLQVLKEAMGSLQKEREAMLSAALRQGGRTNNVSLTNLRERVAMLRREVCAVN
uniref:Kinesin motor domain-containing protein n=1 Tax=Palpitomonas bilix TaxID=652834 RepID=A0A7S3G887_9EUKA